MTDILYFRPQGPRSVLYNEFYIRYDDIDKVLGFVDFGGRDILLPCDTSRSAFVKWFKSHHDRNNCGDIYWIAHHDKEFSVYDGYTVNDLDSGILNWDISDNAVQSFVSSWDGWVVTNPPFRNNSVLGLIDLNYCPDTSVILVGAPDMHGAVQLVAPSFMTFDTPFGPRSVRCAWWGINVPDSVFKQIPRVLS